MTLLKLKIVEDNEDFIAVELPRSLCGKEIPEFVTLKNFKFIF